ncbi:MAG: hypothetical protein V7L01_02865 [Nostoc sp.]|uniref:hypothetical protein n=1 Tax=Nostoc sp. TaxID=1180 RepID=UPI002FF80436
MIKSTAKSLITLVVISSVLLLIPMKSDAQVNMNRLIQVAKSCQKEAPSIKYYQKMGIGIDINTINYIQNEKIELIRNCINYRYHYSLVVSKFPWLSSSGQIMPGYLGSVAVGSLVFWLQGKTPTSVLDCISSQNAASQQCSLTKNFMGYDQELRCFDRCLDSRSHQVLGLYEVHVCPSCVVAHDEVSGSQLEILQAFIKWFLKLDQAKRREILSILADNSKAYNLRLLIKNESGSAVKKYREAVQRVEKQEQERRRRELLGN